jgi:hypothetical protein
MFGLCALVSWKGNSHAKVLRGYLSGIKSVRPASISAKVLKVKNVNCPLTVGARLAPQAGRPVEGKGAVFGKLYRPGDLDHHFS